MAAVTIRSLSEETHRALKSRAARKGTSTESEIRAILDEAVRPESRIRVGSELAALGKKYGGIDIQIKRDKSPAKAASF